MAETCPKGFFCIRNYNLAILIVIITILFILVFTKTRRMFINKESYNSNNNNPKVVEKIIVIEKQKNSEDDRDYSNVLEPPLSQNYYFEEAKPPIIQHNKGIPINIPTRGEPEPTQQLGILTKVDISDDGKLIGNSSATTILPLFGNQLYKRSSNYNYHTCTDAMNQIKLPITINGQDCTSDRGCPMINNNDIIDLPEFNGKFKCTLYNFDSPRYIPF